MTLVDGSGGEDAGTAGGPRGTWLAAVAEAEEQVREAARRESTDPTGLLERLVATAAALVDAPVAVAVPRDARLVWWAAGGGAAVARGEPAAADGTIWGEAWRTGTVQRAPGPGERGAAQQGAGPRPALAVPLVHGSDVLGVLTLSATTSGRLDRNDERAAMVLAAAAAGGLARLMPAPALPDPSGDTLRLVPRPSLTGQLRRRRTDRTDRAGRAGRADRGTQPPEFSPPTPAALFMAAAAPPPAMPDPGGMGLWEWDAVSGTCSWSRPIERLAGLAPGEPMSLTALRRALVQADRGRFDAALRAVRGGHGVGGPLRLSGPGDRPRNVYAWAEVHRGRSGDLRGAWGAVVDVSAFEHDAAALRSAASGLRAAQELTGLGVWEWHPDTGDLEWSAEMYRMLGLTPGAVRPTLDRWHAFVHPEDVGRARALDVDLLEGVPADVEGVQTFRVVRDDGEIRHVQSWSSSAPLLGGPGGPGGSGPLVVHGAVLDVTRQVRDRIMLERLSTTDTVTDLGNRLAFDRRMQDLLARPGSDVSLMLLDLDRFKLVNDSLGHQVGDRLLHEVAQRLLAVVPDGTTTARMGGDEFVVVPPAGLPAPRVQELAQLVVETLRVPYTLPDSGEMLVCPVSVGVTSTHRRVVTLVDLLREADIALYRAKDTGRDRFVVFDAALRTRAQARQRSERRLREALERDLLLLEYQPIVDFGHGRVVGAEALVRMRDPDDETRMLSPDLFMDVAEDTGLIVEVDTWVIGEAVAQISRWGDRAGASGSPPWLAINVSPRSMEHPRVARRIVDAVTTGELSRDRVKVELTEHSFLSQLPGGEESLRSLMAAGVRVGIDDFGTGYSAMAYLPRFDLDFMKIDRSFVRDVGRVPRADAVVTAIVDLAHAHGMRVVAEGVETTRQARRLREIGCDYAQGYHFGRPGVAERIIRR